MSFPASSLRIAGQDSDMADIIFPSFEVPQRLLVSSVSGKHMYENTESIKSWIDTIDRGNNSAFNLSGSDDDVDIFEFATHPFKTCRPHSPFSPDSDISFHFTASAWAPEVLPSSHYDDSDESHSESSDEGQYVTIPSDSPWYRPPSPSPGPVSAHELSTAQYALSCSSDVRQAIAQQELLLAIFHEELRRIVPRAGGTAYDSDWLEGVDADLVLAPLEKYTDLCWESVVCEKSPSLWWDRPMPDVPIGFDDIRGGY